MKRKSLSSDASSALTCLATFNERYFSIRERSPEVAAGLLENMKVTYANTIGPCLENVMDNDTVRRVVKTYHELVRA